MRLALCTCMKFHEVILNGFKVIERTETDTHKVQKGITQNYISKSNGSCTLHVIQFMHAISNYRCNVTRGAQKRQHCSCLQGET